METELIQPEPLLRPQNVEETKEPKSPLSFTASFADKFVSFVDGLEENFPSRCSAHTSDGTRIAKEIKALTRGLPRDEHSSIFVSIDSKNTAKLSALIAGASATPYAHGLFEFHIELGDGFPHTPPVMNHRTSAMSGIGFSPNLYADGYVCLSIINTWSGEESETWSPNKNLLQVLVSIQSLVMEDNIISKEPGWDYVTVDSPHNIIYQNIVKVATIRHAMIDQLKNPPYGFTEHVNQYFDIKKRFILSTVKEWLEDAVKQEIPYTKTDMAYGYNRSLYEELWTSGYHYVLYQAAHSLRELLVEKFGESDLPELGPAPEPKEPRHQGDLGWPELSDLENSLF